MRHDGDDNLCFSRGNHIMASTLVNSPEAHFRWSSCSRKSLTDFLRFVRVCVCVCVRVLNVSLHVYGH